MSLLINTAGHLLFPFLFVLAVGLKLQLLCSILYKFHFPLSKIPGPRLASWSRLWWIKTLHSKKTVEELARVDKEYGPVVRISPRSILVSDPEIIRRVLAVGSRYTRGPWFDSLRLDPRTTNVVSERDPKKHQELRNILAVGLSGRGDFDTEGVVNEHIERWTESIDAKCSSTSDGSIILDLSQTLPFLTLDIVSHLCLGESFQCIQNEKDQFGFLDSLQAGMLAQQYISVLLEIKSFIFWLGKFSFIRSYLWPNKKDSAGIGRVMLVVQKAVEQNLANVEKKGSKGDMIGSFISRGLTPERAIDELIVVLSSGVGSTSYAAQGIIRSIVANPDVCHKLQDEIDNRLTERRLSSTEILEDSVIRNMTYLQACISEGLRVYPPVWQLRERQAPPEGDSVHGYHIPGGTFVAINGIASQFNQVYGENLDEFHPGRWLIDDENQLKKMYQNLDLVFGYGASKCLGVNMANVELNKIVFELFRRYKISFKRPDRPWVARGDLVLSDFFIKIERREKLTNGCSSPEDV